KPTFPNDIHHRITRPQPRPTPRHRIDPPTTGCTRQPARQSLDGSRDLRPRPTRPRSLVERTTRSTRPPRAAAGRPDGGRMRRLPATIDELAGRRAARWIRESTPGQFDRYGPEAQAELQARAISKLGLADSGLAWRPAHSGRTVYRSPEMADMLGAAQRGDFEILLV